ncbi:MAG: hypothetical protein ACN0LA_14685 [Candidatus Longimicrobiales bacterium M2_2A_002]
MTAVIFDAPTRPQEDVVIDYTFGGDAVYGEDFVVTDASGTPLSGVTSSGGTITIEASPDAEAPEDTIYLSVPTDATVGAEAEVQIASASLASGGAVTVGRLDSPTTFTLAITAIPTGTYTGALTGDLGTGTVSIDVTVDPVTISGTEYEFRMDDFAVGIFGEPIDWAFNVLGDGTMEFSPTSPSAPDVTANITGTYDFNTSTMSFDTELTCCGGAGLTWTQVLTLE